MSIATIDYIRSKYVEPIATSQMDYVPVTVCCPLYNSMPFLEKYLMHVVMYDWPTELTSLMFTVQGDDGTYDRMMKFKKHYEGIYRRIKVKRVKQFLGGELPHVRNVVMCRNLLTKWSKPDEYVFFNDHDNFNPPVSIKRLMWALQHGADGAAGVYIFYQKNQYEPEGHVGFTAFFIHDRKMHHYSINKTGLEGVIPREMLGKYIWVDCVSMGAFLVKRKVLNDVPFFTAFGTSMTDDTTFCLKARELGYRFIADFGLVVKHWGYDMYIKPISDDKVLIGVEPTDIMKDRRSKMYDDGVYVHDDYDKGFNEALLQYVDLDKIK